MVLRTWLFSSCRLTLFSSSFSFLQTHYSRSRNLEIKPESMSTHTTKSLRDTENHVMYSLLPFFPLLLARTDFGAEQLRLFPSLQRRSPNSLSSDLFPSLGYLRLTSVGPPNRSLRTCPLRRAFFNEKHFSYSCGHLRSCELVLAHIESSRPVIFSHSPFAANNLISKRMRSGNQLFFTPSPSFTLGSVSIRVRILARWCRVAVFRGNRCTRPPLREGWLRVIHLIEIEFGAMKDAAEILGSSRELKMSPTFKYDRRWKKRRLETYCGNSLKYKNYKGTKVTSKELDKNETILYREVRWTKG
jgi:hypothetical protein